jgi:5-formaminoimidazole-4-carboxamide-1-(beta)-D-ribofuranosyl 5'-monophosphate synthetase
MEGSPYTSLLYDEPMSMGRRISREIKEADAKNQLDKVVT